MRRYWAFGSAGAGTTVVGTPSNFNLAAGGFTVPANVTADMTTLVVLTTANGTAINAVPLLPAGASYYVLDDRPATNMRVVILVIAGIKTGDVITITGSGNVFCQPIFTNEWSPIAGTAAAAIRVGSSAVVTSGSLAPAAGGKVLVVSCERTVATPTVVNSVVPSTGETVAQVSFAEDTTTVSSIYVGTYTAASGDARTVTTTWDDASTNGYGMQALLSSSSGRRVYAR